MIVPESVKRPKRVKTQEQAYLETGGSLPGEFPDSPFISPTDLEAVVDPIQGLALRQIKNPETSLELVPNTILDVMEKLNDCFKTGGDTTQYLGDLAVILSNDAAKNELFAQLLKAHNRDRMIRFLRNQNSIEGFLDSCMKRKDLRVSEAMALLQYIRTALVQISLDLEKSLRQQSENTDVHVLVNRVDFTSQSKEKALQDQFKDIPAHELEIARKLIYKARKIKEVTVTQTETITKEADVIVQ